MAVYFGGFMPLFYRIFPQLRNSCNCKNFNDESYNYKEGTGIGCAVYPDYWGFWLSIVTEEHIGLLKCPFIKECPYFDKTKNIASVKELIAELQELWWDEWDKPQLSAEVWRQAISTVDRPYERELLKSYLTRSRSPLKEAFYNVLKSFDLELVLDFWQRAFVADQLDREIAQNFLETQLPLIEDWLTGDKNKAYKALRFLNATRSSTARWDELTRETVKKVRGEVEPEFLLAIDERLSIWSKYEFGGIPTNN